MGSDTKRIWNVRGYTGGTAANNKSFTYHIALLGNEGYGLDVQQRPNEVAKNQRLETTDKQMRRQQGYRGL